MGKFDEKRTLKVVFLRLLTLTDQVTFSQLALSFNSEAPAFSNFAMQREIIKLNF
ncbi:hypothetical protein [Methylomonas fluvii]|nr:hypothetical protein [Methylomonas fluvii]